MQKPVRVFKEHEPLSGPMQANLRSAVRAAMLMLPQSFTDWELFTRIAGLSYRGDFRMVVGENPKKVRPKRRAGHQSHSAGTRFG
jgi:mitochondrial translocator assembly and maintenance protein 41